MMQLISLFQEANYEITFATTASETKYSEDLTAIEISVIPILLNDASFDVFISELKPTVVLFDRFITEEQFGWRIAENCPDALTILDTEDLHFLRKAREEAFKKNTCYLECSREVLPIFSEIAKRELASILRCDLSLIISKAEMQLLTETFKIPEGLLYYLPFLVSEFSKQSPSFEMRKHFISIGNFQHAPNTDAVVFLKNDIWPLIKKQIPDAQLHIYGAYVPKHISEMHNEKEGFLIKGWAEDVRTVMQQARVCLAPLRFGAGLKGKLLDAALYGTPSVTTKIGGEGMFSIAEIVENSSAFVETAVSLYKDEELWKRQQKKAFGVVEQEFLRSCFSYKFLQTIEQLQRELPQHREAHFIGQILQHQSMQATKFMSKWIEEKNK
ncbi:MAG: glycosyltransferase family 4 protein [Flavobacteriaceae bacterium]|nr:glycosyltransferase family 4 protein [Flavobacteriaceae bacterium]